MAKISLRNIINEAKTTKNKKRYLELINDKNPLIRCATIENKMFKERWVINEFQRECSPEVIKKLLDSIVGSHHIFEVIVLNILGGGYCDGKYKAIMEEIVRTERVTENKICQIISNKHYNYLSRFVIKEKLLLWLLCEIVNNLMPASEKTKVLLAEYNKRVE